MTHLVVTVHGIRTFGDWQRRLERLITTNSSNGVSVHHFVYGYFSMLAFVLPFTRWIVVRRFRRELIDLVKRAGPTRLDLVAHSFGTHIVSWALLGLPPELKLKVNTLILSGSVLRSDFYWADLMQSRIGRVVNDCGTSDTALIASQFFVPFTGMAGRSGFVGMTGAEFCNRYSLFGHSGYFTNISGKPDDNYMSRYWLPLLINDNPIDVFDHRDIPTPWRGLTIWVTNNFEPIKLAVLFSPLVAALLWVSALYIEADAAKARIRGVVALADIMKSRNQTLENDSSLLATMQQVLNAPLERTYGIWVDDNRDNNVHERRILGTFGLCFVLESSTKDAVKRVTEEPKKYSVVVSDFRRDADPLSGYGLLREMKRTGVNLPLIFYVANFDRDQRRQAIGDGAFDEVTGPIPLLQTLFRAVVPNAEPASRIRFIIERLSGCPTSS